MTTDLNIADELERYMLELINAARAEEGLGALQLEQHLNASAEAHSEWMIQEDVFSHTGVDGTSAHDRIVDAGFNLAGSWWTGENLALSTAYGDSYYDEIDAMFVGLMNSPDHRANILSANYDYVGIGIELGMFDFPNNQGEFFSIVATQNFGATGGEVLLDTGGSTEPPVEDQEIVGDGSDDDLTGGEGNDDIRGLKGNDNIDGGAGDDVIKGGNGDDTLEGGAGNDTLSGGTGNDMLMGGDGVNKLVGQRGEDELHGGGERDILNGGGQNDVLYGNGGNDRLKGGGGNDSVYGGDGPDKIYGNGGSDSLFGGAGDDLLNGGGEADWLEGGAGEDRVKGGDGADTFVFAADADIDRIVDFNVGEDTLLIDSSYWSNGQSAQELLEEHASIDGGRIVIDFGGGDQIILQGVDSLDGLAGSIDAV